MMTWMLIALAFATSQFDNADALLEAMAASRADLRVLEVSFEMTNVTPDEEFHEVGNLVYAKPRRVVFRIHDKDGEGDSMVFLVNGDSVFEYDAEMEQVSIRRGIPEADIAALYAAFEGDSRDIRKNYTVSLFDPGDESPRAQYGLLLEPKAGDQDPEEMEGIQRIRIYLTDDGFLPTKVQIINDAESSVEFVFGPANLNRNIDPRLTQIALPAGTVIVEDERRTGVVEGETEYLPEPIRPNVASEGLGPPEANPGPPAGNRGVLQGGEANPA